MKCPNCKSEVGNQNICPYCGATVYIRDAVTRPDDYNRKMNSMAGDRSVARWVEEIKEYGLRLHNIETKLNLILVLQLGTFIMLTLLLVFVLL